MNHAPRGAERPEVARFLREAATDPAAGFFMDFDGTLAPIVDDPEDARPVRGARTALRALSDAGAQVVVISGRPAAFLSQRLRVPGLVLAGLYGAEVKRGRSTITDPRAAVHRDSIVAAGRDLRRRVRLAVEDKGLSVAVHGRRARDPDAAMSKARPHVDEIAAEHGLHVRPGRLVLELTAPGAPDKGSSLRRLCAELGVRRVVAAGDDAGDLPMLRAARAASPRALTIWVANDEAPATLRGAADVVVGSPWELVALLRAATRD